MKKLLCILMTLVLVGAFAYVIPTNSRAAETTFSGTIASGTTDGLIYLSTDGGTMKIKIDGSTDLSGAKFLLPGNKITCTCYIGSDEYWHASKISGGATAGKVSVDTSNPATVKGTVAKGTSVDLLMLEVSNGTMQIKIDSDTDLSGVSVIVVGKNVQVVCARGADAYMHALSIQNGSGGSSAAVSASAGSSASSGSSSGNATVTGTVDGATTSSMLYLNTSNGRMELVLELGTDMSAGRVLMPGQSLTVSCFRGADAWMHASRVINNSSKAASEVSLSGTKTTVTGTVSQESTENTLCLATSGGTMQIRLDPSTNFSRCPVLLVNKNVQVTVQRGSDEYYHAVSIIGN